MIKSHTNKNLGVQNIICDSERDLLSPWESEISIIWKIFYLLFGISIRNPLLDIPGYRKKHLLYIKIRLCTLLQENSVKNKKLPQNTITNI